MFPQHFIEIGAHLTEIHEKGSLYGPVFDDSM